MAVKLTKHHETILQLIEEGRQKAYICSVVGCRPSTLDRYLVRVGIEYKGNMGGKGCEKINRRLNALDYLETSLPSTHRARLRLIRDGIKEHRCEVCGYENWMGKPIPLELHHKDGNRNNWDIGNLEIICPNCHAQTNNHAGKGKHKPT